MVKYYGRARQRIGSVNTNQIGLKMSGCPSKVGRQGYLNRYIASRVQCNQKFCGPVYYHGQLWKWNSGRCVAKAPRGQSFNSGVGHKNTPRFACGDTCAVNLTYANAIKILGEYFKSNSPGQLLCLVGKKEYLGSDGVEHPSLFEPIKHYYPGTSEYTNLPLYAKQAVDVINSAGWSGPLKKGGSPVQHVVGTATLADQLALAEKDYGNYVKFAPDTTVIAYSKDGSLVSLFACAANLAWKTTFFEICAGAAATNVELDPAGQGAAIILCAQPLGPAVIFCITTAINAMLGGLF